MKFRGAFHAHSTYSYDGRDTLERLAGELRRRGFHFLLLTEHDDQLTPETYARVVAAAEELSGQDFLVVPGLEIRCWRREREQWHLAAVGVRDWISRGAIQEVVSAVRAAGGLAIFLHPYKHASSIEPSELGIFDGIEVWNGKFDGFYAPQGRTLRLFRSVQKFEAHPSFYCGHDLHGVDGIAPLLLEVDADRLHRDAIIEQLRRSDFQVRGRGSEFPSRTGPGFGQAVYLRGMRAAYECFRLAQRVPILGAALGAGRDAIRPADPFE